MRVEVSDGSADLPVVGRGGPEDVSGRGLRIVDHLAHAWGVLPRDDGKAVWIELVAPRH